MRILDQRVLVLASAGSGKTYQLGNRILGYVAMGMEPETIAALTFTRKAAGEFADSVLSKAANAVLDGQVAMQLEKDLQESEKLVEGVDFARVLESLVRALPRMVLGTMDGFFTKVVQGFPHEIGINEGKIRLVEGAEWEMRMGEVLQSLLGDGTGGKRQEFLQAFRQSQIGREVLAVRRSLENFIGEWHGLLRHDGGELRWGPMELAHGVKAEDWNRGRHEWIEKLRAAEIVTRDARHQGQWQKMLDLMEQHTTGSGKFKPNALWEALMRDFRWRDEGVAVQVTSYNKQLTIPAADWGLLCETMWQMAMAEMARVCEVTGAIRELIGYFDELCERNLRRRGMLCFDDVKVLMGAWVRGEDQRLAREAMDFRLQERHRHWLLDEFQDTSRADWRGLFPLIDEAATAEDGSLFLVGDRKQAIYAWRGGDVRLFDEVEQRYGAGLTREVMSESYRSCCEVLEVVNRVCRNLGVAARLFPVAAQRWEWEDHVSAKPEVRGHACVKMLRENDDEEVSARLVEMLEDMRRIGAGVGDFSCGVLVRTNQQMMEVADYLRGQGYQVVEDGQRMPARDHVIGVSIHQWLRWLADPGDGMAMGILQMSPVFPWLESMWSEEIWEKCHAFAQKYGFAAMVECVVMPQLGDASEFARQRCMDAIDCLRSVDASGRASARFAEESFAAYCVAHPPGPSQIQVMTIHKSKGLGFDVVFLPCIADDKIPHEGRFDVARGSGWICKTPPSWVREMSEEMTLATKEWEADQQYEAMCLLYVALTRAKRGLYVYLPEVDPKKEKSSHAHWIFQSMPLDEQQRFEAGRYENLLDFPTHAVELDKGEPVRLFPAEPLVKSARASQSTVFDAVAVAKGRALHKMWATLGWLDEDQSADDDWFKSLADPQIVDLLSRKGRVIDLHREVPIDGMIDGNRVHAVVDRLQIHYNRNQEVVAIELIEWKSDANAAAEALLKRYKNQWTTYKTLLARIWPGIPVRVFLITHDGAMASA